MISLWSHDIDLQYLLCWNLEPNDYVLVLLCCINCLIYTFVSRGQSAWGSKPEGCKILQQPHQRAPVQR